MTGRALMTVSPSSSSTIRSTPCEDGCCGPKFSAMRSSPAASVEELVPVAARDGVDAALGGVPGRRVDVRFLAIGVAGRHGGHLGKPGSGNVSQTITGRDGARSAALDLDICRGSTVGDGEGDQAVRVRRPRHAPVRGRAGSGARSGQVRIEVHACGRAPDRRDTAAGVQKGPPLPELPTTPGREVAGVVTSPGPWSGKRVVAHLGPAGGGYASVAVAPVERAARDARAAVVRGRGGADRHRPYGRGDPVGGGARAGRRRAPARRGRRSRDPARPGGGRAPAPRSSAWPAARPRPRRCRPTS